MAWRVTAIVGRWAPLGAADMAFSSARRLPGAYTVGRKSEAYSAIQPLSRIAGEGLLGAARAGIGMLRCREAASANVSGVFLRCGADFGADFAVALDKLWGELGEQAKHVVGHQDLAVTSRRAANADRRDRHLLR